MRAAKICLVSVCLLGACGGDDAPSNDAGRDARVIDGPAVDAPRADAPLGDGGGDGTVTLTDTRDSLAWVAAQDGADGAWQVLTDSGGGTYTFDPSGEVYGLAFLCSLPSGTNMVVIHATVAEVPNPQSACVPPAAETLVDISGSVGGLAAAQTANINVASRQAMAGGSAGSAGFTLEVPMGTRDIFARRITTAPTFDRAIRMNDATLADGATFDFDFAGAGFTPETHTVTIEGAASSETTGTLVVFRNPDGGSPHPLGSRSDGLIQTFPVAELRPSDIHSIVVNANDDAAGTFRNVRRMARAAVDFTASMPPMQPAPTFDAEATTPYLRPRATLATAGDPDNVTLTYSQRDAAMLQTIFTVTATRGWIAATGATTLAVADYSALTGFDPAWGLRAGEGLQTQHFQNWSSLGVADAFDVSQTTDELDGAEYRLTQYLATTTL